MVAAPTAAAFEDYFSRRNANPRQVAMLAGVTIAACAIGAFAKEWATSTGSFGMVIDYHILRWGVGELLWCWLAADHAFSEIGLARRQGHMADWEATPNSAPMVAGAFARATYRFIAPAVLIHAIGDALQPYPGDPLKFLLPQFPGSYWAFQVGAPVCMAVAHLATARMAVLILTHEAFLREPTPWAWARSLMQVGLALAAVSAASLFLGFVVATAAPVPDSAMAGGLRVLRLPHLAPLFLAGVLVGQVSLKWLLAVAARRRIAQVQFPAT